MRRSQSPPGPSLALLDLAALVAIVGLIQLVVGRFVVPHWQPPPEHHPPTWHATLAWGGTFLRHFIGVFAGMVIVFQGKLLSDRSDLYPSGLATATIGVTFIAAFFALFGATGQAPESWSLVFELVFAGAVLYAALAILRAPGADLPARLGVTLLAVPVLMHAVAAVGSEHVAHLPGFRTWPDQLLEAAKYVVAAIGLVAPLLFGPRPLGTAVLHPLPLAATVVVSGAAPLIVRKQFQLAADLAERGFGIHLGAPSGTDVMWLLALLGMVWTVTACLVSRSRGRRGVGLGLALISLAGFSFSWPYLMAMSALGFFVLLEAVPDAAMDEAQGQVRSRRGAPGPVVAPEAWREFADTTVRQLAASPVELAAGLVEIKEADGVEVTRITGRRAGVNVRLTITRDASGIQSLVITCGADVPPEPPAWTLVSKGDRSVGHGATPPSAPGRAVKTGDAAFDKRFVVVEASDATGKLLDDGLRARATAILDGWIALWPRRSLRYVVTPGRGAPPDVPIPLREVTVGSAAPTEGLVRLVDLVTAVAGRADLPQA